MLLLLFPTLPTGARRADLINGRTELGCQCFLQSLRLELGAAPLPLCTNCLEEVFSEIGLPASEVLGNRGHVHVHST